MTPIKEQDIRVAFEELEKVSRLVSETLHMTGYQSLQDDFATSMHKLKAALSHTSPALVATPEEGDSPHPPSRHCHCAECEFYFRHQHEEGYGRGQPASTQEQMEAIAYLVDGRIEQGLFFDKESAQVMAEANCGTVKPLYAHPPQATKPAQEPVYQVQGVDNLSWVDVPEEELKAYKGMPTRTVFISPQPAQVSVKEALNKERDICADIALSVDSLRGNEQLIAKTIRERKQ